MLSAHLMVQNLLNWETVLAEVRALLHDRYAIDHVTLQPESAAHAAQLVERYDDSA